MVWSGKAREVLLFSFFFFFFCQTPGGPSWVSCCCDLPWGVTCWSDHGSVVSLPRKVSPFSVGVSWEHCRAPGPGREVPRKKWSSLQLPRPVDVCGCGQVVEEVLRRSDGG